MKNILITLSFLLALSSCTTEPKPEIAAMNKQIKAQVPADAPEQIMSRAAMAFSNAEGLTAEQKIKLSSIYTRVYTESMRIRREIGQSKSLLFSTLAKVDYKDSEIKNLKKRIVTLDQQRLNLMFGALDDVQKIVGRGIEAEKIYKHFEEHEKPRINIHDEP